MRIKKSLINIGKRLSIVHLILRNIPESIKWFDFGIDGLFIEDFLPQHRDKKFANVEKGSGLL